MSDGTADERHEAVHTDEDPLLNGKRAQKAYPEACRF